MRRREEFREQGISGGRFVQPTADALLPPKRTSRLQGGRFVQPAANNLLPPIRRSRLQMDWDNAYHFGAELTPENVYQVGDEVRGMGRKE